MKSSHPAVTLDQAKAIREIELRLAELEQMRRCIAREMSVETATKPAARKGLKRTH